MAQASAPSAALSVAEERARRIQHLGAVTPDTLTLPTGEKISAVAFYAPDTGLMPCDERTGGAPFANFYPLDEPILVRHRKAHGLFYNSEAAYQSLKWWQSAEVRAQSEACDAPGLKGGGDAFRLKRRCEADPLLLSDQWLMEYPLFDGLGKFGAMLLVLRQKWRQPGFREFLCSTSGMLLVEHSAVKGRDPYWTDDHSGGGQNRLGAALMLVRDELLREDGRPSGWPVGVLRPLWVLGADSGDDAALDAPWRAVVDHVAAQLCALDGVPLPPPPPPSLSASLLLITATLLGLIFGLCDKLLATVLASLLPYPDCDVHMNLAITYSNWCARATA